ncbi:hypothetical protein ABEB36_001434 [Hypothenemus hampei]|uniref:Serine aminopeptidase S33 domain-containing protein n=1 Tax=Hypothenemus hampei TaxID=57062 RepID=A0ABD1FEJ3_HYPHA
MPRQRFNDYYLVCDEDMADDTDSVEFRPPKRCSPKKIICVVSIVIVSLALLAFFLIFVTFPLIFKYSVTLQQTLVFTRWNLMTNKTLFQRFRIPLYKNHYVPVKELDADKILYLGLWHILPFDLAETAYYDTSYDYDAALQNTNYSVLLYFHGTGEDRSNSWQKYQLLRQFFHVIAFDYRGYGDSDEGTMFERNVVNDCVQVYQWLRNRTNAAIYIWGHSLGTALATGTIAQLDNANITGFILESSFTTFRDELYYHPYVKYFRWLPWFESTVVNPLTENGFIFNNTGNVLKTNVPFMFLHARDDEIVPYFMSRQLYNTSLTRNLDEKVLNASLLILYNERIRLNHYFIYRDSYTYFYIYEFMRRCSEISQMLFKSSHQS